MYNVCLTFRTPHSRKMKLCCIPNLFDNTVANGSNLQVGLLIGDLRPMPNIPSNFWNMSLRGVMAMKFAEKELSFADWSSIQKGNIMHIMTPTVCLIVQLLENVLWVLKVSPLTKPVDECEPCRIIIELQLGFVEEVVFGRAAWDIHNVSPLLSSSTVTWNSKTQAVAKGTH